MSSITIASPVCPAAEHRPGAGERRSEAGQRNQDTALYPVPALTSLAAVLVAPPQREYQHHRPGRKPPRVGSLLVYSPTTYASVWSARASRNLMR